MLNDQITKTILLLATFKMVANVNNTVVLTEVQCDITFKSAFTQTTSDVTFNVMDISLNTYYVKSSTQKLSPKNTCPDSSCIMVLYITVSFLCRAAVVWKHYSDPPSLWLIFHHQLDTQD